MPYKSWPEPIEAQPDMEELEDMMMDGVSTATDGCEIEPDGVCSDGYPSWLLYLGLI